jgi:YfiH family protein
MLDSIRAGRLNISFYLPGEERPKKLILPKQVHGTKIVNVVTGDEDIFGCDGLISNNLSLTLGIATADCAPVCFFDGKRMGIAHVGWRGFCDGMIEKMLSYFDTKDLEVYVGPFLHSFEIKKDFCYDAIVGKTGTAFFEMGDIIKFDFREAIKSVLPAQAIFDDRNTYNSPSLPSFRRDKKVNNFITVINVRGDQAAEPLRTV